MGAFISYSLFMLSLKKAHFVRVGRIKTPNSMAAWLAPPLKCRELFFLCVVISTGSAKQSGFWSESDLVQIEKAVCVIKCYWVFLSWVDLADCGCISIGLMQYRGCKTGYGSEAIVTNLLSQKKSTVRFCPVAQSVAVQLTVHIRACLSSVCIF